MKKSGADKALTPRAQEFLRLTRRKRKEREEKMRPHIERCETRYITGLSTLNIPYEGMQCDWHRIDTLRAGRKGRFVTHPTVIVGAEEIFGEYGIWDCGGWLEEQGGFDGNDYRCATPIRAILDLLYFQIVVMREYPLSLDHFRDFMFEDLDLNELHSKLEELEKHLDTRGKALLREWRENNEV